MLISNQNVGTLAKPHHTLLNQPKIHNKPGPSNRKRLRDAKYMGDHDNSDIKLHLNLKKPKRYVIILDEEEGLSELRTTETETLTIVHSSMKPPYSEIPGSPEKK